ncbi:MAG: HaeII family restriction endonuclease [Synergistaceae bacterium]|nr:HaeII family restriction endonuclease [Synergistaceae bacterium]
MLSLDEELAEDITGSISGDRIIIVCRDAEKNIIHCGSFVMKLRWNFLLLIICLRF